MSDKKRIAELEDRVEELEEGGVSELSYDDIKKQNLTYRKLVDFVYDVHKDVCVELRTLRAENKKLKSDIEDQKSWVHSFSNENRRYMKESNEARRTIERLSGIITAAVSCWDEVKKYSLTIYPAYVECAMDNLKSCLSDAPSEKEEQTAKCNHHPIWHEDRREFVCVICKKPCEPKATKREEDTETVALKPCPNCKRDTNYSHDQLILVSKVPRTSSEIHVRVECKCGCCGPWRASKRVAMDAWNKMPRMSVIINRYNPSQDPRIPSDVKDILADHAIADKLRKGELIAICAIPCGARIVLNEDETGVYSGKLAEANVFCIPGESYTGEEIAEALTIAEAVRKLVGKRLLAKWYSDSPGKTEWFQKMKISTILSIDELLAEGNDETNV